MRPIALCLLLAAGLVRSAHAQVGPEPPTDLRDVFARGFLIEDRNADDVTDFVRARIVLPPAPSVAEVAAAANIAARLGYETSALDMGLVAAGSPFDVPVVLVGARALPAGAVRAGFWGGPLAAGEGAVDFAPPGRTLRAGGLSLDGGDATGLPPALLRQMFNHPLTEKGLAAFLADWAKTGQSIL
jgi:hypothetical protein